jgi:sporulation protein YlmC with PRC-barrel domain
MAFAAAAIFMGGIASADEPASSAKKVNPDVKINQRASEIIGMKVKNASGKDLGTVNDVVLDVNKGTVRYFAVSYGGFLGLGDKLFAIPPKSFEWKRDGDKNHLVLNLTEERLKNAPGFDQDHWPDFATDAQWREKIDTYYIIEKIEVKRTSAAK